MLRAAGMLMIGSSGRKVGKSELACALIRKHASRGPIVGIKVTTIDEATDCCPHGDEAGCGACASLEGRFAITAERDAALGKDTSRMLAAGAGPVLWLRVRRQHLAEGAAALLERIGPGAISVCESNSLRRVVEPDVLVLVRGRNHREWKESARLVRHRADRLVSFDGQRFDFDLDEIALERGRWSMPVQASAVVLAGGGSRRMGSDKSLLPISGRPLIAQIVNQLRDWFDEVLISADDRARYAFLGLRVIVDREPGLGPLMGIASALRESRNARNFVIACDIPDVDRALVREMLARATRSDVVIPVDGQGRLEPLFAVYRRDLAGRMFDLLTAGKRRIVSVFDRVRVERLAWETVERMPNLNTQADYLAYRESKT